MNKLTTYVGQALGKQKLLDALKAGGWKVLIDGTLAEEVLIHGPGATLVGVDQFGNRYFEDRAKQTGRERWVVYAKFDDYRKQEPSTIPPQWHAWLHRISEENPTNSTFVEPIYGAEATAVLTGGPDRHLPKGAWINPKKRSWLKYQAWVPPRSAGSPSNGREGRE